MRLLTNLKAMERKTAKYWMMLSVILFVLLLLTWRARICSAGGLVTWLTEEGLLISFLWTFLCIVCLLLVFCFWSRCRLRPESKGRAEKGTNVWTIFCIAVSLCLLISAYHHSAQENRMPFGGDAYISHGVLPVLEQLREESPVFLAQKPVEDGFVNIDGNFFAPVRLILRQDGAGGEWYHILYAELRWDDLAEIYAREMTKAAEKEGWILQPVDGGLSWIADYPREGEEVVLLFHRGSVVVKVTYHGPEDLVSRAAQWKTAFFPEA